MKKEICIVTNGYPTKDNPVYAFIQPVAQKIADAGFRCTVIAPQSVTKRAVRKRKKRPYRWIDKTEKGNEVVIYQPEFFSVSNVKVWESSVSEYFRDRVIQKCFQAEKMNPDVIYAHFWDCGMGACKIAEKVKIPVIVATGESSIRVRDYYAPKTIERFLPYVKGVIAVSTKNLKESREMNLLKYDPKSIVLPNAVNPAEFYPASRVEARRKLHWNTDDQIAIFVGAFIHRKGSNRVLEAAKHIPELKLAFIGTGEQRPESEQVIFSGAVPHDELVTYLNAADFFVLPTLAEGCCNAIIEAMACGLPVISSDRPFNDDIMTSENSIRIDPTSISQIAGAMERLYTDLNLRKRLAEGALLTATELRIENRVQRILSFVENVTEGLQS